MMTPTIVNIDSTDFLKQLSNYIQYKPDYENLTITVEKMDDDKKEATVLLILFGRETPTDIPYMDLKKVD